MKYLLITLFLVGCSVNKEEKQKCKIVWEVGGCNASGYCGVTYADNSYGIEHLPAKYQYVCK